MELEQFGVKLPDEDDLIGQINGLEEKAEHLRKVLKLVRQIRGVKPPRSMPNVQPAMSAAGVSSRG